MLKLALALIAALGLATGASADCDHFKWPLAREKVWFAQAVEPIEASAEISRLDQAFALALKPSDSAGYLLPLKRPAVAGTYGGVVKVSSIPKPGVYQVTLTREAWVDVVQNGARAQSRNVSRQRDCVEMRKSVRFELAAGPAAVQISGVDSASIVFALAPAPKDQTPKDQTP